MWLIFKRNNPSQCGYAGKRKRTKQRPWPRCNVMLLCGRFATFPIFQACVFVHVYVLVCVCASANEKERETIWWIVSYMASISSPVIYGVNNIVYSQACSPLVFLFVVQWQKYYNQTTHLLYPILIQKPINPVLTHNCTIWRYGWDLVYLQCVHTCTHNVALFVFAHIF